MPMVSPSFGWLFSLRAITAPPLPVTFCGMIFQPLVFSSSVAINRAWVSAPPPAANAIIRLIGPLGFHAAAAEPADKASAPAIPAATTQLRKDSNVISCLLSSQRSF